MRYSDPIKNSATGVEIQTRLAERDNIVGTLRIPENLKNSVQEVVQLKGMRFSAYVRMALINELAERR